MRLIRLTPKGGAHRADVAATVVDAVGAGTHGIATDAWAPSPIVGAGIASGGDASGGPEVATSGSPCSGDALASARCSFKDAASGRRFLGIVKSVDSRTGTGQLVSELGVRLATLAGELAGFAIGDPVSFRLAPHPDFGHVAADLEAEASDRVTGSLDGKAGFAAAAAAAVAVAAAAAASSTGAASQGSPSSPAAAASLAMAAPSPRGAEQAIRRRIAAEELRAAIAQKDKLVLQQSLAKARRADVEVSLLSQGERLIRTILVEGKLRTLIKDEKDAAHLRSRLSVALEAGVENRWIQDAEAALAKRCAAVEELEAAVARGGDRSSASASASSLASDEVALRAALARAKDAGVRKERMREAQAALRRAIERRQLADAVSGLDEEVLRSSLARARERDEVEQASGALERIAAIGALAEAVCGRDEGLLADALDRARRAGVNSNTIDEGVTALERIRASKKLAVAVDAGELDQLNESIAKAKALGIPASQLQIAEAVASRISALVELDKASGSCDVVSLKVAISLAEAAGIQSGVIQSARRSLRRAVAMKDLEEALETSDAQLMSRCLQRVAEVGVSDVVALDVALDTARAKGVAHMSIAIAEVALAHAVAAECVREAIDAGDEESLRQLLEAARGCGATESDACAEVVAAGEARLRRSAARRSVKAAVDLMASLRLTGTFDAEGERILREAVEEADAAEVEDAALVQGREELSKIDAERELCAAISATSNAGSKGVAASTEALAFRLRAAIADAERVAAVDENNLRIARIRALRLEKPRSAMIPVKPTLTAKKSKRLASAIDIAAQLEEVRELKRRAVAEEDFDAAAELKKREAQLEKQVKIKD